MRNFCEFVVTQCATPTSAVSNFFKIDFRGENVRKLPQKCEIRESFLPQKKPAIRYMYVCNVCMYVPVSRYVWYVCIYIMYIRYVCTYAMYICMAVHTLSCGGLLPDVRWNFTHTTCIIFTAISNISVVTN